MPHCHTDVPGVEASTSEAPVPPTEAAPPPGRMSDRWKFLASFLAVTAVLVVASLAAFGFSSTPPPVQLAPGATIYYNEACSDCQTYLMGELMPALEASGAEPIVVKDYINTPAYRQELRGLNDALGIPFELQSHLATFVQDGRLSVFEGHVPGALIAEALSVPQRTSRLLVHQDEMDGAVVYGAWAFDGETRHYDLGTPLSEYLSWFAATGGGTEGAPPAILPLVLTSGFVDGLNPCAFAVLLFFVTFLFVARRPRAEVARVGLLYIYAVFLAYLLIGLGLMGAIMLTEDPHFLARVSGVLVAAIGVYVLVQPRIPALPDLFHMPKRTWDRVRGWMLRGTSPAAAASGFLVGLCTFPCSGGIYVAVLGLLAAKTSYVEGLGYLYLYNVAFVLPLVVVLAVISNKTVARQVTKWERGHTSLVRTVGAVATIVVGVLTALLA